MAGLKAHRKRQLKKWVERAGMYDDEGLIFSSEIATPLNPEPAGNACTMNVAQGRRDPTRSAQSTLSGVGGGREEPLGRPAGLHIGL
jgi:hypothetical protein